MASHRITVTIPERLHRQMVIVVPSGKISEFVAEAVEERLATYDPTLAKEDPIDTFRKLRYTIPPERQMSHEEILKVIRKGRQ